MERRKVLVLNAGSSSLKYQVIAVPDGGRFLRGHVEEIADGEFGPALDQVVQEIDHAGIAPLAAVGHRVVHGGPRHTTPELVDDVLLASIDDLARLAPLHNPPAAEGIRRAREAFEGLPQVAVFDTAYFSALPEAAATYALDAALTREEGIRRYGMHGTSHQYVASEAAAFLDVDIAELKLIVLHLGNGSSAAAIRGGRPVDTSMGLTPLEGLVMGSRGGDVDPGVLLHLLRHAGLDVEALDDLLNHRSGMRGLTGTSDLRDVLSAAQAGDRRAGTRSRCLLPPPPQVRRRLPRRPRRGRRSRLHRRRRREHAPCTGAGALRARGARHRAGFRAQLLFVRGLPTHQYGRVESQGAGGSHR